MALTDVQIRNAKATSKAYKLWRMKFRHNGKEGLLSFGPYPLITLAEAREKRDSARRQIRDGLNPSLEKRRAAIAAKAAAANTFAIIAEEVVAKREREGLAPTTAAKLRWYASLLGKISSRPIGEIEAFEVLESLRKIEASGRYETAVNTLSFAGRVFRYAVATGRARRDVAADLRGALTAPKVTHHAAIIDAEGAGRIMRSIDAYTGQTFTRLGLTMLAHTFPRPGELRLADCGEFDMDEATWRIPAARTKMRKEHLIPLSRQAVATMRALFAITDGEGLVLRSFRNATKPIARTR
jgi:integrase